MLRKENVEGYYYPLIDTVKLVCAFLVVLIHCVEVEIGHPIATFIVKCFSTQAVPFFMITSGFFAANKIDRKTNLKKLLDCVSIIGCSNIVYGPYYGYLSTLYFII